MEKEHFQFVFEDSDDLLVTDSDQEHINNEQYGEIVYANGSQTILLHNGEYYIQTDSETLLLGSEQDSIDQLVINENTKTDSLILDQPQDDSVVQYLEEGESNEPVVYRFTDGIKLIQNEGLISSDDAAETESKVEQPVTKRIKLEGGFIEFGGTENIGFDVEKHLRLLKEQEYLTGTGYQYAVLKDGKLHFQLCEADSVEVLTNINENDDSSQALQEACTDSLESSVIDLSKVTGRNLVTGQTVTLDDYLERIHNKISGTTLGTNRVQAQSESCHSTPTRTFLNRKFMIGKTVAGKRLVGKILQIKMGSKESEGEVQEIDNAETLVIAGSPLCTSSETLGNSTEVADDELTVIENDKQTHANVPTGASPQPGEDVQNKNPNTNIQELIFDETGRILEVNSAKAHVDSGVTTEHLEFLSKTLSGLADMDSIRKKVLERELHVKFVEKRFENQSRNFRKVVTHLKGYLTLQGKENVKESDVQSKDEYVFVLNDAGASNKQSEGNDTDESTKGQHDKGDLGQQQRKRFDDHTSLSVILIQDKNGHKSTRVNFYEKQDNSTVCKLCNREFRSLGHLNRHLSTSHSDKMLTCHVCHIKFGDPILLNKHRKQHEHYFVCATCGKNFTTQSSLRRHLSVHDHSLRPLECTICSARFTDESSLCKHLIIHTGIRAYHCNMCKKAFTTLGDLNFHRRVHDPVKLFYCDVCGREFSRHSNLLRHTEIHKGAGQLFKCAVCGCSYKFISSLTRHVVQNHMTKT